MDDINQFALDEITGDDEPKELTLEQRLAYHDDEPTEEE